MKLKAVLQRAQRFLTHQRSWGEHKKCLTTSITRPLRDQSTQKIFKVSTSQGWPSLTSSQFRHYSSLVHNDLILKSPKPDIHIPENVSVHQLIFQSCDQFKDALALEDYLTGEKLTYSQLKEKSIKLASALHRNGLRKGDVVLVFATNCVAYSLVMLACSCLGALCSPANSTFTPGELRRQIKESGATVVFSSEHVTDVVREALNTPELSQAVNKLYVIGSAHGFQPIHSLLEDDGKAFPDTDIDPINDIYALPYSSGTTGLPKGVMLTHYSIVANLLQLDGCFNDISPGVSSLGLMPMYHIYGMVVVQYGVFNKGGVIVNLPKFDPDTFLGCMNDRKINIANLVPPLIIFLTKYPGAANFTLPSLARVTCGAAPLGPDITRDFLQKYPHVTLKQGYGLTECSPVTNYDLGMNLGSVGPLLVNTLAKVIDPETKQALGPGQEGEYWVKGPQVMKGYLGNPKATAEMIDADGWLHTGDLGYYTESGLVYITDRLKDLIKYKGSQVSPAELEALLLTHPDIADVAVVGIPDHVSGELPRAYVVKQPGSVVSEEDIVKFVEGMVAPVKRLRGGVQFIDQLPRSNSGKILKRVIISTFL